MISRRDFLKLSGAGMLSLYTATRGKFLPHALAQISGGTLEPTAVPKYQTPLLIPPVMPRAATLTQRGRPIDYYEISMKQFKQQILPAGMPKTTVWGYGAVTGSGRNPLLVHNAPSLTIEAQVNRPVRVKWINKLVDQDGNYLPHLLPVDPTLHWANPPGGTAGRDTRPNPDDPWFSTDRYTGPVPIITHVHGAVGVGD
jgi:spore coat protein A, manganese oxidase